MWPKPNTVRVDARLKWISEPLFRPIPTRYVGKYEWKSPFAPVNFQYFWFDLVHDTGLRWVGQSGVSPGGASFEFAIEHYDVLPHGGVPGVRWDFTYSLAGEPDGARAFEWYDALGGYDLQTYSGSANWQYVSPIPYGIAAPGTYGERDVYIWPLSECYPADQITTETAPMPSGPISLAQWSRTSDQSVSAGASYIPVQWQSQDFGLSTFWNSGSDPSKILIPSGFNWIRATFNAAFGNFSGVAIASILLNGSAVPGGGTVTGENTATDVLNCKGGWIAVTSSDYVQAAVIVGVNRVVQAGSGTWLQIEASA